MKPFKFKGLMAPAFTPFTDDGKYELNLNIIPEYLQYLHQNKMYGILVNGTSGEGVSQSVEEREKLAEKWIACRNKEEKYIKDMCFVIQVGGGPIKDVIRLAKHAESIGADGIMCLPDLFFRPSTIDSLCDYLKLIYDAVPNIPLLYYHIPVFTAVNLSMSEFMKSCAEKIPSFVGIKFTSADLQEFGKCVNVCKKYPERLKVFLGCDDIILPAYTFGSKSVIATTLNIIPNHIRKMDINYEKSDREGLELAMAIQRNITEIITFINKPGTLFTYVPMLKAAMTIYSNINLGPTRPPLMQVSDEEKKRIQEVIKNHIKKF